MSRRRGAEEMSEERAYIVDSSENIVLSKSPFTSSCREELKQTQKHEMICKISQILGPCPSNFSKAEMIFDAIRFDVAQYVIHHEYNAPCGVSADLLLWLDSKLDPGKAECVSSFFSKYLK